MRRSEPPPSRPLELPLARAGTMVTTIAAAAAAATTKGANDDNNISCLGVSFEARRRKDRWPRTLLTLWFEFNPLLNLKV
jgi:hypothetical protein